MPITLTQQTALITGASRGIARGIALKLAKQGVKRIAINYKENDAAAEDAARLLKERDEWQMRLCDTMWLTCGKHGVRTRPHSNLLIVRHVVPQMTGSPKVSFD